MFIDKLNNLKTHLRSIDALLDAGEAIRTKDNVILGDAVMNIIYHKNDATIGVHVARYDGERMPLHQHKDSVEFLICSEGSVEVRFGKKSVRVLRSGDCLALRNNELHSGVMITKGSTLIFICVPAEKGYGDAKE